MASNSTNATMSFQTPINSNAQVFETGNHHSGFNLLNANQMTPTFGNNSMSNSSKITFGNSSMTSSTPINQTFGQPLSTFNETQSSMSIKSNKLNDTIATSHTLVQLIYTPLDSLSEEERGLFAAPNFTLGMVPVKPPPKEYC